MFSLDPHATAACGAGMFHFVEICAQATSYAQRVKGRHPAGTLLLLQPRSKYDGMVRALGLWRLGLVPVFDDRRLMNSLEEAPAFSHDGSARVATGFFDFVQDDALALAFLTSGSTGTPKLVKKRWRHLFAELRVLRDLYGDCKNVVSFVSPFHIFGCLHSFLLTLATGASVYFYEYENGIYDPHFGAFKGPIDLLVTVPATWELVKELAQSMVIRQMVSSGAPFGEQRQREALALRARPTRLIEIMGSTETGGIGYREMSDGPADVFHLFSGITLTQKGAQTEITSPYIFSDLHILDDRVEILAGRSFRPLSRTDQVFKFSGRRFSLQEIERNLRSVIDASEVKCQFIADESVKGGELQAFVETRAVLPAMAELRRAYMQRFTTPFPSKLHVLAEFPRDANGKVLVSALKHH